ncbi:MAG: resuscitation-promoting factor RpfA [Actinomycetota bacterium]|nr:resuscitation-promoting factor RpfA [Actinomycetota bacterium]
MYAPKHSAARKVSSFRKRASGLAVAATATVISSVNFSPPAQAAASVWDRVAACESGGNWAINTGNGYFGGLQFSTSTWRAFGGGAYAPTANKANKATQILIAQRVLVKQGPGAWPVCSKRAGLTRANGAGAVTVSRSKPRVAINAKLVVDGKMGPMTVRAIQRWVGVPQNGVFGSTTKKALQRKLGVPADGAIGPRTLRALQIKVGAHVDGARTLNAGIVAALQRYLNTH